MIVRNGGQDLSLCLESVRGIADEIVIADTGSTDDSVAVALSFGAAVISIPWENDFAAARNAALHATHADWVLVLDADEQLDTQAQTQIADALKSNDVDGYMITIRNYVQDLSERLWDKPALANDGRLARASQFAGYLEHENVRLFRNKSELRFEGRVHETVGTGIERRGGKLGHSDFIIHHFGFVASAERKAEKNLFYRELGHQKIQDTPNNAQAHFELGLVELDNFHNNDEALRLFVRSCELNDNLAIAWFFRAIALSRLQRDAEALLCFARARQLGFAGAGHVEAEADSFYNCKQFSEARQAYRRALQLEHSAVLLSKIGLTEVRLGNTGPGLKKLHAALRENHAAREIHDRMVAALLILGRIADAAKAAETGLSLATSTQAAFLRTAALWMHAGQTEHAAKVVAIGLEQFPQSAQLKDAQTELQQRQLQGSNQATPQHGAAPVH
jgi:glycosyltransferase involved in cell wall biosynthesis